jgi:hypothetical protein
VSGSGTYNGQVRRLIAALTLVLVTVLHATDPVICPDGCTDDARQSHSATIPGHDAPSSCLLCQSSMTAGPEILAPSVSLAKIVSVPLPDIRLPMNPARRIEHPPRTA